MQILTLISYWFFLENFIFLQNKAPNHLPCPPHDQLSADHLLREEKGGRHEYSKNLKNLFVNKINLSARIKKKPKHQFSDLSNLPFYKKQRKLIEIYSFWMSVPLNSLVIFPTSLFPVASRDILLS